MDKVLIKFSSKDLAIDGKSYNDLIEEGVRANKILAVLNKIEFTKELEAEIKKQTIAKNDNKYKFEKGFLNSLLISSLKSNAGKIAVMFKIQTLAAEIEDAESQIEIDEQEFRDYISKALEDTNKETKAEVQVWWIYLKELFGQISNPVIIKEDKKEVKEEAKTESK